MEIKASTLSAVSAQPGLSATSKILIVAGSVLFLFGLWYICTSAKPKPIQPEPVPSSNPPLNAPEAICGPVNIAIQVGEIKAGTSENLIDVSTVSIQDKGKKEIGQFSYKLRYRDGQFLRDSECENGIPVLQVFDIRSDCDSKEPRSFLAYVALLVAKSTGAEEIELNFTEGHKRYRLTKGSDGFLEKTLSLEGKRVVEKDAPFCLDGEIGHKLTFAEMEARYKELLPDNWSSILPAPPKPPT